MIKNGCKWLLVGCWLAGCSAQTPPKTAILQKGQFYLRYVAAKRELQAEARLVADTGSVYIKDSFLINSKGAEAMPLSGKKYKNEFIHKLVQEGVEFAPPFIVQFPFNSQRIKHSLNAPQVRNLRLGSAYISPETGGLILWDGEPFGELDAVHIIITDAKGQTYSLNHAGRTRSNELPLPAAELQNLAKGQASLQLSFQHNEILREGQEIHKIIEYYCNPISIEVR